MVWPDSEGCGPAEQVKQCWFQKPHVAARRPVWLNAKRSPGGLTLQNCDPHQRPARIPSSDSQLSIHRLPVESTPWIITQRLAPRARFASRTQSISKSQANACGRGQSAPETKEQFAHRAPNKDRFHGMHAWAADGHRICEARLETTRWSGRAIDSPPGFGDCLLARDS
jgi:hypothetical protein